MEVVADEEDLLDGGLERVDQVAGRGKARRGDEDGLVVFDTVLGPGLVEAIDDMGVGDQGDIESMRRGGRAGLLSPEFSGEQATERGGGEGVEVATVHEGGIL